MRILWGFVGLVALATSAPADPREAGAIALLVEKESPEISAELAEALRSEDPLGRAVAARVAIVKNVPLVPELREALSNETDVIAAREQIRALALLDPEIRIGELIASAKRFPTGIDRDLAVAVARRGSEAASDLFLKHRQSLRSHPDWKSTAKASPVNFSAGCSVNRRPRISAG